MVLTGTIVNGVCIAAGTLLGKLLHRIPEKVKTTVMQGISLAVIVLGLQMAFKTEQLLIVIFSLVIGSVLGEWWKLDDNLNALGHWIERKVGSKNEGNVAKGFVTATLIFVIGAMAIIGALDSGLRADHRVLYTKSILDGFTSLILASTLGIGVMFSAIPVMLYQGSIALFATQIERFIPEALLDIMIVEMTATGGVLITAIGINLLGLMHIRVANMLPAILVAVILATGTYLWQQYDIIKLFLQ
ncbi:DUF554 domain-containing protein [Bacillus sp. HMF5848]|uniref:DUF554 domain-containing protein n=1 Tax=Bacillus sp. HMF5848 TaxID=2495421 RepID=UPI000F7A2D31|nr:DUF554 domain-containing protein [Bacillus sp. HMF5848]RSK29186.1 DUF554 domain-containing protein [Bacillus sp. HMF5848]